MTKVGRASAAPGGGSAGGAATGPDPANSYRRLVRRVVDRTRRHLPPGGHALVVSRGDNLLLGADGVDAQHFPQTRTGLYAGYHPADGREAVAHLEELRLAGAEYLVLPASATWWLDHYDEFREYLLDRCERVVDEPDTCLIFALERAGAAALDIGPAELDAARTAPQVGALARSLLPDSEGVLFVGPAAEAIDAGHRPRHTLAPADGEITPPAHEVLAWIAHARAEGARYLALLKSEHPREHIDERVRRSVTQGLRPVCIQRLVEIYELGEAGG